MSTRLLEIVEPDKVGRIGRDPVDAQALRDAADIVDDVRAHGARAVREHSIRFGDIEGDEPLVIGRDELEEARSQIE